MFWAEKIHEIGTSSSAIKIYSGFCVNVAAGWFLASFIAPDLWVFLKDIIAAISYLCFAIIFDRIEP